MYASQSRVWKQIANESSQRLKKTQPACHCLVLLEPDSKKTQTPKTKDHPRRPERNKLQLALEVLVVLQPVLDILAITLQPVDLGADSVQALGDGTIVAL